MNPNNTNISSLKAISPIDGRYHKATEKLQDYFSEFALMKYRIEVEIEYLIALSKFNFNGLPMFSEVDQAKLRDLFRLFDESEAQKIKEIEAVTNHDVKAIEYYIKNKCAEAHITFNTEFIHFGLTSQDINNTAVPLSLKRFMETELIPEIELFLEQITLLSREWKDIPLLAKTHGQPASPTTLGKEFFVFCHRIELQLQELKSKKHTSKFGGATGNLNAHKASFPEIDWVEFANTFSASLGLDRQQYTTQIEHYDHMASIFDNIKRLQNILIDLSRDVWSYVSFEIFKQKINPNEVGSSAMPHKVNPIDFENAEGNLMYSNAILEFLSSKLPISRLQRDLTDSTVLRNIGVPLGHSMIALKSIRKGINKLQVNHEAIEMELEKNWLVVAEGIQNILRKEGIEKPYELLKEFTRNHTKPSQKDFIDFVDQLTISDSVKAQLKSLSPNNYLGYATLF
jgi:adenylosuccinate lyase